MNTRYLRNPLAILAATATLASTGHSGKTATATEVSTQVAVVVRIPIPSGVDHTKIEGEMSKTVPYYKKLPGLIRKYFTISDDQKFGGIYLWESRKAAEAYYNEEWCAHVAKTYGSPAEVTYFSVPIVVEGEQSLK